MTIVLPRIDEIENQQPSGGFGALECDYGNLPLKQLVYHVSVVGLALRSSILQTFYNPYDQPIEAIYIFPIEGGQAVVNCEMRVADRTVRARLKERSQARADYQHAIRTGHRAALLEENRSETFSMRVGNIPPGEAIVVKIETVSQLSVAYGEWTLRIPLVVAPRYTSGIALPGPSVGTGVDEDTNQVPDASTVTPPTWLPGFASPVDLRLSVELQMGDLANSNWINDLKSSLHTVVMARDAEQSDGRKCKLQIFAGERINRDFILRGKVDDSQLRTAASIEVDPVLADRSTFAVHIVPPRVEQSAPRDVVFLLDHSGSMGGWKMAAARRGIARLVDSLTSSDRFQVLAFDDSILQFETDKRKTYGNGNWVDATDANRFEAVRWIGNINVAGGTEMGIAIEEALCAFKTDNNLDSARSSAIVLVTDGQITGEDSVLRLIGSIPASNRPRIYCLGIDRAVNASVLKRIAEFTGGTFELVESESRLSEVLLRFGGEIGMPAVRDLRVASDSNASIELAPAKPLTLYTGKAMTIYGRLASDVRSVNLLGILPDGSPWNQTIELEASKNAEPILLPMWAKVHVRELEDQLAASGDRDPVIIREIITTSTQCSVLSRLTAFIAVDETEKLTTGQKPHTITQPVEFPEGWMHAPLRLKKLISLPTATYTQGIQGETFDDCRITGPHVETIAQSLLVDGTISKEQLQDAIDTSIRRNSSILDELTNFKYVNNEEVAKAAAKVASAAYVDPETLHISEQVVQEMPESVARENCVMPIGSSGDSLEVLVCDPYDLDKLEGLRFILNRRIVARIASATRIRKAINEHYGQSVGESADSMLQEFTDTQIDFTETEEDNLDSGLFAFARSSYLSAPMPASAPLEEDDDNVCQAGEPMFRDSAIPSGPRLRRSRSSAAPVQASEMEFDSAPLVRLLNYLIQEAVALRASHIVIETCENEMLIKFILDGKLVERDRPPKRIFHLIILRIASLAKLDASKREGVQSGMMKMDFGDKQIDVGVHMADDSVLLEFAKAGTSIETPDAVLSWWQSHAGIKV